MTKRDRVASAPGDLYLATLDAKYELSACGATPKEAMRLLHALWLTWWRNREYGDDYTWRERVEGGSVTLRVLRAGVTYVDDTPLGAEETWAWAPDRTDGTSDYVKVPT